MPYGLILDVDGVIADTEPVIAQATIDMFREFHGVELTPDDFRPFIGTGAVRYVEGPAGKLGISLDLEAALARRTENFARLLGTAGDIACPGVHELVNAVNAADGWTLAIATSSPGDKFRVTFGAAGMPLDAFAAIITGDMVTHKKPHPEIYLTAANALDLASAACVVVEDAVTGVESAKAAGMKCIAVTSSFDAQDLAKADLAVASLTEVDLEMLRSLAG